MPWAAPRHSRAPGRLSTRDSDRRRALPEFYEIIHARVRDGIEEEVVARRPALGATVKERLPGLLEIRLVRLDDGTYLAHHRGEVGVS